MTCYLDIAVVYKRDLTCWSADQVIFVHALRTLVSILCHFLFVNSVAIPSYQRSLVSA